MLLFLLFPDDFERIFAQHDRRAVAVAFSQFESRAISRMDRVEIDRTLRDARRKLETEYGTTELDYYVTPLRERWKLDNMATISEEHVRAAIEEIDRDGIPPSAQSTTYDLIESGRRFPPKLVVSLAARHASGEELDRRDFTGGEESTAFKLLRGLSFEIRQRQLSQNCSRNFSRRRKVQVNYPCRDIWRLTDLNVKVSFGKGNFARIPWIAFLANDQAVSNGIYPVLLLFREQKVLLLCYGLSEENGPEKTWGDLDKVQTVQTWFQDRFGPETRSIRYILRTGGL